MTAPLLVALLLPLDGCGWIRQAPSSRGIVPKPMARRTEPVRMTASFYGSGFHGNRTASGDVFDPHGFTAAHPTLPFGTRLRVRNPRNGATTIVTVNDRGPFVRGRDLDVSLAAAKRLGIVSTGVARVEVEILDRVPDAARARNHAPGALGQSSP